LAIQVLGEGKYLRFLSEAGWEYVMRPHATGVVVIVAITPARELILVEQHRVSVHASVVELPAGLVGDTSALRGETLETAAHRELVEETGFEAEKMVELGSGPISVGVSSEVVTFFHAQSLRRVGPGGGDDTEDIAVHLVPLPDLRGFLAERQRAGRLIDPKIFSGLYLAGAGGG
jgi:ADP-ribose pyrophosphatase